MWFWLASLSALLGAIDIILNKKALQKVNATLLTWSLFALSLPINIYLVLQAGIPAVNYLFLLGILGSSIFFVYSKTLANYVLKESSISKILPLTALGGIFTYIFGLIFLSETLRLLPVLGIVSVVIGVYLLNADKGRTDLLKPIKLLFTERMTVIYLIAIMLSSITSIFDKIAINNTNPSDPVFTLLNENLLMTAMLSVYLLKKEKLTWVKELKQHFPLLTINSILYLAISILIFFAFTDAPVALVLAIKRLQIFFILLLGWLFFQDKPTRYAWIATIIMAVGVLLIKLG